jgi:hypothetical protein
MFIHKHCEGILIAFLRTPDEGLFIVHAGVPSKG